MASPVPDATTYGAIYGATFALFAIPVFALFWKKVGQGLKLTHLR